MQFKRMTDEAVCRLSQSGNQDATRYLLEKYEPMANSFANLFFLQGYERDDVVQVARMGLWAAIRSFRQDSKTSRFNGYAYMIIKRRVSRAALHSNYLKHRLLNEALSLDAPVDGAEGISGIDMLASKNDNPAELVIKKNETHAVIEIACYALSFEDRLIFERLLAGDGHTEIGSDTGKSRQLIEHVRKRIVKKLRTELNTSEMI